MKVTQESRPQRWEKGKKGLNDISIPFKLTAFHTLLRLMIKYNLQQERADMLRRNMQIPLNKLGCHKEEKQQNYSPSTDDSGSPRSGFTETYGKPSIRKDKEKSQLCKKYLEFGFCPYEKKCKFAHGSHELRKNQQFNSKYKTKECGVFLSEGYCMYGERCNFIHNKVICSKEIGFGDAGFQEVKAEGRLQSRLLSLLSLDSQ